MTRFWDEVLYFPNLAAIFAVIALTSNRIAYNGATFSLGATLLWTAICDALYKKGTLSNNWYTVYLFVIGAGVISALPFIWGGSLREFTLL